MLSSVKLNPVQAYQRLYHLAFSSKSDARSRDVSGYFEGGNAIFLGLCVVINLSEVEERLVSLDLTILGEAGLTGALRIENSVTRVAVSIKLALEVWILLPTHCITLNEDILKARVEDIKDEVLPREEGIKALIIDLDLELSLVESTRNFFSVLCQRVQVLQVNFYLRISKGSSHCRISQGACAS